MQIFFQFPQHFQLKKFTKRKEKKKLTQLQITTLMNKIYLQSNPKYTFICMINCQNDSGKGFPFKNDRNNTNDLSGCENGASCDAPLTVANENIFPYT